MKKDINLTDVRSISSQMFTLSSFETQIAEVILRKSVHDTFCAALILEKYLAIVLICGSFSVEIQTFTNTMEHFYYVIVWVSDTYLKDERSPSL